MADLIALMNSMVDARGNILIPAIMQDVIPVTPEEEELYDRIDFSCVCFFSIYYSLISKILK